jgi:4-alpha-glucanotransferase
VALEVPASGTVPWGYHKLTVEIAGKTLESTLIAAPRRAYQPPSMAESREWGVFLPLYALHSRRSLGVGDLTDMRGLIEWAARRGAGFVGTLPLLASFLEEPFDPSPYSPMSRLFWNELFIDPSEDVAPSQVAAADSLSRMEKRLRKLNAEPLVPYREVMALKREVLEEQSRAFFGAESTERQLYEQFVAERPEVEDYARFRAAVEKLGPWWRVWPESARDGELAPDDYDEDAYRYYAYAQWRVEQQMQTLAQRSKQAGSELYLDLPVGVHAAGYDAWRYQSQFVADMAVGAPPDIVTTSGQNWGFQPLNPEALRRSGYEYVRAYLAHHMRAAGMLRVDHAMGLHRLYWIPRGAGATEGTYVHYAADELYAVHSLESHRHEAAIAGENLGIVPAPVNDGLSKHGIAKMYVMMIELREDEQRPFRNIPREVVASFGTHDLPPFASFWHDLDIEERLKVGVLTPERAAIERKQRKAQRAALVAYLKRKRLLEDGSSVEQVYRGVLAALAGSKAERVLVNLEDTWLETLPQNIPGTLDDQHPNWRRRARYGLEELDGAPGVREALDAVRRLRPRAETGVAS